MSVWIICRLDANHVLLLNGDSSLGCILCCCIFFFFQAEDGIRDVAVTGVQTCALPISQDRARDSGRRLFRRAAALARGDRRGGGTARHRPHLRPSAARATPYGPRDPAEIGRASCRERV